MEIKKLWRPGWMTSNKRKRQQRAMNKAMRLLNQNIENDPMWKGRYYIRQKQARWVLTESHPNFYELYTLLELVDRKTNVTKLIGWNSVNVWNFFGGSHLFWPMNDFIIESGVWEEEPRPTYENTPDYRPMKCRRK